MKILNRKEFLLLPENTLFAKYHPCVIGELAIKGETFGNDFYVQSIADSIEANDTGEFIEKLAAAENGEDIRLDLNCEGRDGMFDDDQLFMVYDKQDVEAIIKRLSVCAIGE